MQKIYIVLTQTHTALARVIRLITKDKYSHASISFDPECNKMYSFGRKYYPMFWYGTFKEENINERIFKEYSGNEMTIYELKISDKQYKNIMKNIENIRKTNKGYNLLGLIYGIGNKRLKRNKYYCSEFIYEILSNDNVGLLPETNNAIKPEDLLKIKDLKKVYEGKIREFSH